MANGPEEEFQFSTRYQTPREKYTLTEPPNEWYAAVGRMGKRIERIVCNDIFTCLGDGAAILYMGQWRNAEWLAHSEVLTLDEQEKYKQQAQKASEGVLRVTGFTAEEINAKQQALEKKYQGKTEASELRTEFILVNNS